MFLATNSGDLFVGSKEKHSVVVCTDSDLTKELTDYEFSALKKNTLVEISPESGLIEITSTSLERKIKITRKPSESKHIYYQEILGSIEAIKAAINSKFLAPGEVVLGGFEKAREELVLIENFVIAAAGPSKIAADYGSYVMKFIGPIFNSIIVADASELSTLSL